MMSYIFYGLLLLLGITCAPNIINQILLFSFLYIDYSLNTLLNPKEFPAASKKQYAQNFGSELGYSLGKYYNHLVKYFSLTVPGDTEPEIAILLVHGFSRNEGDWLWLRKQFADTGCPVYTVALKPQLAGIDTIAQQCIAPKIAAIKQETGCKQIILIGASMGGIVSSYYKEYLDNNNSVAAVFTLGSPLHGTKVAVAAPGENSKQMCPQSKFLEDLLERMRQHPHLYYQVCSKFDEIIFPWDSALFGPTPSTQQMILSFEGHLGMLHNVDVAKQLNSWVAHVQEITQEITQKTQNEVNTTASLRMTL